MKTYLITGATGYIGSMLTNYILSRTDSQASEAQVTALVRNQDKATSMFPPEQYPQECLQFVCADLTDEAAMAQIDGKYDYIIHCAAVTKSAEMIAHPTEVIDGIVNGTRNIMELAHRCHAKSVVYLSSMEVYGDIDCSDGHRVSETELGFVDILNVRSCYPMSKRMAETICYSYFKEYGVPVKIARLAQTFGTGLLPGENRVFAQFADAAYGRQDIVLHTEGRSMGNYCDIQDAMDGILLLLEKGADGEAYNVVNEENTMTIRQVAELVAERIAHHEIQIKYDIPEENKYGYARETGLRLSAQKLQALGWKPTKGLEEMFRDVIAEKEISISL